MPTDDLDAIDNAMREAEAGEAADGRSEVETDRTAHLKYAWRLFERICERDPGAVGDKESIFATFKECLATVRHSPSGWSPLPKASTFPDLDDDVPFCTP